MTSAPDSAARELRLFDAYAFVFRAFYAMPPLTSPAGEPVGAVYGFVKMVSQLLKADGGPAAAIFDHGTPSFRQALFPEYKAHRPEAPEDLRFQFPLIREACEAMGLRAVEQPGMEADDIIATLAKRAEAEGMTTVIVSSDKDLMQLVNERVVLLDPVKQKRMGPSEVLEKMGVPPHQVRDYLALTGDAADNVPGVKGIGPKTAVLLLQEFGDLETVLSNPERIARAAVRKNIVEYTDIARLSRQLVSLCEDAVPGVSPASLTYEGPDPARFRAFAEKYGFKSLAAGKADRSGGKTAFGAPRGRTAQTAAEEAPKDELKRWDSALALTQDPAAFAAALTACLTGLDDIGLTCLAPGHPEMEAETEEDEAAPLDSPLLRMIPARAESALWRFGLDTGQAVLECACSPKNGAEAEGLARALAAVLASSQTVCYAVHLKPILRFIYAVLPETEHLPDPVLCDDIGVMAYAAGMDEPDKPASVIRRAARFETEPTPPEGQETSTGKKTRAAKVTHVPGEAAGLARGARLAGPHLAQLIRREGCAAVYYTIDRPLSPVLARMEHGGVYVDAARLHGLSREYHAKMETLSALIYAEAGGPFNIASPKQLGEVLFERMGLQTGRKTGKTKAYSTDAETLEGLHAGGAAIAGHVLDFRRYAKLVGTYTEALPKLLDERSRVHTTFAAAHTSTGRLSSLHPNVQNIPVRREEGGAIRSAFRAEPGYLLLSIDYSQIELRLLASMAEIPALKAAFAAGQDVHAATAAELFGGDVAAVSPEQRRVAKTVNFGVIYGVSAFGLAAQLGVSREEAKIIIERYFTRYPEIRRYMEETVAYARAHGFVRTLYGRKCLTPHIRSSAAAMRQFAERAAVNAPLQGTAADIIRLAMRECDAYCRRQRSIAEGGIGAIRQALQVHDELLFEAEAAGAPAHLPALQRLMNDAARGAGLSVPMNTQAGFGEHWQAAH